MTMTARRDIDNSSCVVCLVSYPYQFMAGAVRTTQTMYNYVSLKRETEIRVCARRETLVEGNSLRAHIFLFPDPAVYIGRVVLLYRQQ